jgi:hypothetical protein
MWLVTLAQTVWCYNEYLSRFYCNCTKWQYLPHNPIKSIWQHAQCTPNVLGLKILGCIDKLVFSLTFLQWSDKYIDLSHVKTNSTNNLVHSFYVNRALTYTVYYYFTHFSYSNLFSSGSLIFHRNFYPFLIWFQYINSFYILKRCSLVCFFCNR